MYELDNDIDYESEFEPALNELANEKAAGENGVLPDVAKALKGIKIENVSITGSKNFGMMNRIMRVGMLEH